MSEREEKNVAATTVQLQQLARRVVDTAAIGGLTMRVLGGVAVSIRCPAAARAPFARRYQDVDFMGLAAESTRLEPLLVGLGLVAQKRFNALNGHRRLMFVDEATGWPVDVLLDWFEMCHRLDFRDRLTLHPLTLGPADLLLTKLQVVQMEEKDEVDALALLVDHAVGTGQGELDASRVAGLCAGDWGLSTTVGLSLKRLAARAEGLPPADRAASESAISTLQRAIEEAPKGAGWRARARVGTRVKWYKLPEEVA